MLRRRRFWASLIVLVLAVVLVLPLALPLPPWPDRTADEFLPAGARFINVAGLRTVLIELGNSVQPAVVLVHGFEGSTFSWRHTLPALQAAGYHAIAFDLKGFGLADKTFDADYSHAAQADFVAAVMTAAGIERATLVGHSMGGSVVAHFAMRHAQRVDQLVFVAGAITDRAQSLALLQWVPVLLNLQPVQRWGQLILRTLVNPAARGAIARSAYYNPALLTPEVERAYLAPQNLRDWDLAQLGVLRDALRSTLPAPLHSIAAPTLVVWGGHDSWVPLAAGMHLHKMLPGSAWAFVPLAGHLPMEEQPAAFNTILLNFLRTGTLR
jgi:pimeloyl-ACP methyl ester carboxylesterase